MQRAKILHQNILYPDLSYMITGFLFNVHGQLGKFANEKQYADALETLLAYNKVEYVREYKLDPSFDGELPGRNIVDFIIDNSVVIELKAKTGLTKEDYFQVRRYLDATGLSLGILVNFHHTILVPKRILNSKANQ